MSSGVMNYEKKGYGRMMVPTPEAYDSGINRRISPYRGIIVAIPAFNEEVAIGSIVILSLKYAETVLVIDDGSHDNTSEIARMAGAEVIRHDVNQGKGMGIKEAFQFAKERNAKVLVLIDGDGQHNPDEIPLLIKPILSGEADIVNGSRFIVKNGHQVPKYRRVGQEVLTAVTNLGSKRKVTDSQNGFRAFSGRSFDCFSFENTNMAIESEMLIDAASADMRIKEVQIYVRYDVAGSTYNPIVHGLSVLVTTIAMISRKRLLLFFGTPGIAFLLLGVLLIFFEINTVNITPNATILYGTTGVLSIVMGILCLFSGVILSYIQSVVTRLTRAIKEG
ncbi:MAG TPA: glycosyltransferase family 2 protein [Methanocella sp.]|uniref:glycosyltransferase family 2 protein n=1 Tax=Methanocella sp. TaxID=2052833 RepID=UPI002D08ADE4|nr:glycosyltransferase family 2 protein [Methanocella sp.]HTY90763.1 glycosyltransferase family 2 protein [Methanocella sp.]